MLADPPHLSRHQSTPSTPPLSSSCFSHRSARLKTSNPSYHRNQQYSIIGLTNAAGTLVERYSYTAYGTLGIYDASGTVRTTSTYANRYTYTGREYDPDLNLYHFRARWYDPAMGVFLSRDPFHFVDGYNLYRLYIGLYGRDPLGLWRLQEDQDDKPTDKCKPMEYFAYLYKKMKQKQRDQWKGGGSMMLNGCIGATLSSLGYGDNAYDLNDGGKVIVPLDNCYDTLEKAKTRAATMNEEELCSSDESKCNIFGTPRTAKVIGFAFWDWAPGEPENPDGSGKPELPNELPKSPDGEGVNLTDCWPAILSYRGEGYFNFDFWYFHGGDNGYCVGANQGVTENTKMTVYVRSEELVVKLFEEYKEKKRFNKFYYCAVCEAPYDK